MGSLGIIGHWLRTPSEIDWGNSTYENRIAEATLRVAGEKYPFPKPIAGNMPPLVLMEDERQIIPLKEIDRKRWVRFSDYGDDDLSQSLLPKPPSHIICYLAYNKRIKKEDIKWLRP